MTTTQAAAPAPSTTTEFLPAPPADALALDAPVVEVTLLEDRAQVRRRGRMRLKAGHHKLLVRDVAPVLQDVSLRAVVETGEATATDARARRAWRIRRADKPAAIAALEERIVELERKHHDAVADARRARDRVERLDEIMARGLSELPVDAAWGTLDAAFGGETFEDLSARARALRNAALAADALAVDLRREGEALVQQRRALDRPDTAMVAWLEVDVAVRADGEVTLALEYVVPNALWRPLHRARLDAAGSLHVQSSACCWQNTGEDWEQASLAFSTARSSLGTEPPLLSDDLVSAQKKAEQVVVAARNVAIQKASAAPRGGPGGGGGGGGSPPAGVDLPGVDDGGESRNLRAPAPATVRSDGEPHVIPLFESTSQATVTRVCMPEVEPRVVIRALARNTAAFPLLAGPVELLMENGFVGYTRTPFVAAGEEHALGFGPDDSLRVTRKQSQSAETDPVDKWKSALHATHIYLSNLSGTATTLEVTERIPVSEIEHVKVVINTEKTSGSHALDADGRVTWKVTLDAHGHRRLDLHHVVRTAPGVKHA